MAVHMEVELARFGGLARLGEMIFIPSSYGIFYLSSIKNFMLLVLSQLNQKFYVAGKRLFHQVAFTIHSDVKRSCRTNVLTLFN